MGVVYVVWYSVHWPSSLELVEVVGVLAESYDGGTEATMGETRL